MQAAPSSPSLLRRVVFSLSVEDVTSAQYVGQSGSAVLGQEQLQSVNGYGKAFLAKVTNNYPVSKSL